MADIVYDLAVEAASKGRMLSFSVLRGALHDLMMQVVDCWRALEVMGGEEGGIEWVVSMGEKLHVDWVYSEDEEEGSWGSQSSDAEQGSYA